MSGRWETGVGASVVPGGGPAAQGPGPGAAGPQTTLRATADWPSRAVAWRPGGERPPPLPPGPAGRALACAAAGTRSGAPGAQAPPSPPAPSRARPPAPGPGQRPPGVLPEALPGPGPRAYWFSTPCRLVGDLSLSRVTAAGAAQKCRYSRGVTSTRRGAGTARGEAARAVPGGRWRGSYRRRA